VHNLADSNIAANKDGNKSYDFKYQDIALLTYE